MDNRKYPFSWDLLGDIAVGRPNLGPITRIELYRLMQYTFRDVIEAKFGTEKADEIFYESGRLAGLEFFKNMIGKINDFHEFIRKLQELLRELRLGILRVEKADIDQGSFVFTVDEDLDCSGLPESDQEICKYDEGFIAALMESFFADRQFCVKEVDCWCTGDRTCRFTAEVVV
ncbi:4-vinyl reductase [Pelotomaculum isophthalicicum JI]|uniref:4-vinyl reductase n=1 Tax=Pelotomaculum isophthalicicum JI TaxID=947010 RepID=A0A9X4JW92_9FIRM|nr:V4R domain-containing protein [Pelotomaculum isophthalicicum]MDF9408698.1 4-vinyl reductase [Pelotomaculum isophthalicicum JI]